MNVTTNEKHLHFINFVKLIEESNMSEVLGSFSADPAALFTVNKNLVTNELSLAFQKDGNPICFLFLTVSNTDEVCNANGHAYVRPVLVRIRERYVHLHWPNVVVGEKKSGNSGQHSKTYKRLLNMTF